jgi:hypothetical protein
MLKRIILTALLLIAGIAQAMPEERWELATDRDGIRVWTREVPGSPLRAFKATMVVRSSLSGLINLIMDTDSAPRWVYRTDRIQVLKRDDARGSFVIRVETDFPWPLSDRDVVVAGQVAQDERTGTVSIISRSVTGPEYPPDPSFVRMPEMEGSWIFRPLGAEMVEVTMLGRADPSGAIPPGVVNLIIDVTPFETMRAMRRMLADPRYQRTPVPMIREPGRIAP